MEPLGRISVILGFMYLVYIMFAVFAFMNAVTSVFVDNAMLASQSQQEQRIHRELEMREELSRHLEELFNEIDVDGSGMITVYELEAYLQDQRASAYFAAVGIRTSDAETIFKLF